MKRILALAALGLSLAGCVYRRPWAQLWLLRRVLMAGARAAIRARPPANGPRAPDKVVSVMLSDGT